MMLDGFRHYGDVLIAANNYGEFIDLCERHSISGKYVIDSHSIAIGNYKYPVLIASSEAKNTVIGAFRLRYPGAKVILVD